MIPNGKGVTCNFLFAFLLIREFNFSLGDLTSGEFELRKSLIDSVYFIGNNGNADLDHLADGNGGPFKQITGTIAVNYDSADVTEEICKV